MPSAFHGASVEASFSSMGDILNAKNSRTDTATCAAVQTVRFHITAKRTTAVDLFSKTAAVKDPVPKKLLPKLCRKRGK